MKWFRRKNKPDPILEKLDSILESLDFILHMTLERAIDDEVDKADVVDDSKKIAWTSIGDVEEEVLKEAQDLIIEDLRTFDLGVTTPIPLGDTTFQRVCSICGEVGRNARTCRPGFGHMSESEWRHLTETE